MIQNIVRWLLRMFFVFGIPVIVLRIANHYHSPDFPTYMMWPMSQLVTITIAMFSYMGSKDEELKAALKGTVLEVWKYLTPSSKE